MRRRDEVDFTEFATAAVRRLRRTAYLMCGDWHRAEDAAQDALVRVCKAWDRLNHQAGLNTNKPIRASYYDAKEREIARFDSNPYNPYATTPDAHTAKRDPIFPK